MFRIVALFVVALFAPLAKAQPLQTVAEKSDYKATSKYADVIAFCEAIAKRGPTARLEYFGTSHEGRKLPLLVISDPPVATAEEAKKADKIVVLAFANIHAGEVDGKEALLALARDLTDKKDHTLLKDLVILLVPILNADGNDKIDPKNRHDNGPVEGAGLRENAQGLDLNRDFVKLETPEVRSLVKVFNTWEPSLVIDCHTTNGSNHRHTLTYDGPRYPSSDRSVGTIDAIFREVRKQMKANAGFDIAPYGNFSQDRTKWETYPALPRYGVQYLSLRGQIGMLSESYSYAPFKDRVKASHEFVSACFASVAAHKADVLRITNPNPPWPPMLPVRTETITFPGKQRILGFEEEQKDGKWIATDKPKDYDLEHLGQVKPTEYVDRPLGGYLIPVSYSEAIETIRRHGIAVEELREDIELPLEAYQLQAVEMVARPFQKHALVSVEVKKRSETRRVPAGTVLVRTTQPLGTLAAYLLEPRSEDGLLTWGMFNDELTPGKDFPVLRLRKSHPLTVGPLAPLPDNRVKNQPITEALLVGHGGGFSFGLQGSPVSVGDWLDADYFLQTKEGKLWKVEARTGKAEPFADPEKIAKSLKSLKDLDASEAESIAKRNFFRMTPDHAAFTFSVGPDLALAYFDGRPAVRLTKSDGSKESVTFSPDSKRLAFVRGGNLFAVEFDKPEEKQLTHDGGSNDILNGQADWVYEEEIFNRDGKAFWWSPDGKQLAFMRFDDSPVKKFNIVNFQPVRGQLETYPYPKVGDPNPVVKIGVVSASGGKPVFLDLGENKPEDIVISRVGWLPDSKTVFAYVQDRSQTRMDFTVWSTPDAKPKVLFRDSTKAWVDDTGPPHWLPDGTFLYASDCSGWRHLYHFAADGKQLGPVTSGDWEVKDVLRVDGDEKQVYFTATFTSHTGTDLCRVKIGEKTELLTEKGKSHRVSLAPSGPLFIDRYTDPMTPTKARLIEAGKGEVRTLDTNPVREKDGYKFGKFERVKIPMKDGFELEGTVTYPPDFDATKKHPVWLFTYAGPHMPTIRDEWGGGRILDNSLATSGIIVLRVDPRSASGKGAQSAWTCYKQLGVQELKDLEETVAWLAEKPGVDASRVGISGHSYGGFMAAYALTHSKTFSAGIASGPVTDWKLYDTIYTERYMLTPKENAAGYSKSSCVTAAKNLSGKLLLVHGMMDDNVHMQNSTQFADALQRAGKDFELMFYPQARHGIGGAHYLKLQTEFIRRTMGVQK